MPTQPQTGATWEDPKPTALLVLADGTVLEGIGFGATGQAVGEVCFNTAMTGYEEILTDPSYAGQIITFTFPHIGNVGINDDDIETVNLAATPGARGVVLHSAITEPSNYRATKHLDAWLKNRGVIGLANHGQPRRPEDWGSLRAWAWGAGRVLDYLENDPSVDGKHVAIEGVSRYGKAALVTMAFDPRFAAALVGS